MKKIAKILSAVLSFALVLPMLAGCHGKKGTSEFVMPAGLDPHKTYEIVFWAKNDTNITQTKIYNQAIEDFEKLYPNIKVNLRLYTDYNKIYNDVITNISTGTTPNVCITYPDHIATYKTGNNVVVPLDTLIDDPRYGLGGSEVLFDSPARDEVIPEYLNECVLDDHVYALPYMRSTEACYVNKEYVEALGYEIPETLTWDFIWEVSEKALAKNPDGTYVVNGKDVMIPCIYKSSDNMLISMLKQQGAGYSDNDGNILIFNDTTKQDLMTISEHTKTGAFSTFKISGYPGNFFNAGECIFAIDSTAGATWMGTNAPLSDIHENQIAQFTTVVKTIPQFDPDNPYMISQGPSICVFNKPDSGEVLASWLFAQYMLTNEVQIAYSSTEGYVPVTSKARNSAEYQEYFSRSGEDNNLYYSVKIDAAKLLIENTSNTFVTPVFNGSTSLRNAAGQLIENTAKSTRRGQTIDDAYFESLYDDTKALYRLDQLGSTDLNSKADLGPMPAGSIILLSTLGTSWVVIVAYFIVQFAKKKRAV